MKKRERACKLSWLSKQEFWVKVWMHNKEREGRGETWEGRELFVLSSNEITWQFRFLIQTHTHRDTHSHASGFQHYTGVFIDLLYCGQMAAISVCVLCKWQDRTGLRDKGQSSMIQRMRAHTHGVTHKSKAKYHNEWLQGAQMHLHLWEVSASFEIVWLTLTTGAVFKGRSGRPNPSDTYGILIHKSSTKHAGINKSSSCNRELYLLCTPSKKTAAAPASQLQNKSRFSKGVLLF